MNKVKTVHVDEVLRHILENPRNDPKIDEFGVRLAAAICKQIFINRFFEYFTDRAKNDIN